MKQALEKETDGFSFAAMADLVISVKCLGNDFKETINTLKELHHTKLSSESYYSSKAGF